MKISRSRKMLYHILISDRFARALVSGWVIPAALMVFICYFLWGCQSTPSTPPSAIVPLELSTGCCGWATQASIGTPAQLVAANPGFQFAFPVGPGNQIHQLVTAPNLKLNTGQTISATFKITGNSPVFIESDPCTPTPGAGMIRLYFQQTGDTWSGAGAYASYRWWSQPIKLALGTNSFKVALAATNNLWTNVQGQANSSQQAGFTAALGSIQTIGFGFGGCFGSHGAQLSSGNAIFQMESYVWQ